MSPEPLQIVLVAFRNADQLAQSLLALDRRFPVTVVDNSSSEDVHEAVRRYGATYLDPGDNVGFAAGVNVALRHLAASPPSYVLLLNPDAVVRPRDLQVLMRHLDRPENERVAAVSPRLVSPSGAVQRVVWPFPTPMRAWMEAVGLGWLPARRTFLAGAVLMLRWEAIGQVGEFDERFFLYAEEADWQLRAANAGWTSALCGHAVAEHRGAGTSTDALRREVLFHAGQETYIRKWHGRVGWLAYRSAACCGALVRSLILSEPRRSEARRRGLIYLRGPRRLLPTARA